jgi:hypothetical protein
MSLIYINPYAFASTPTDPNFADVSVLLHGDGTNGSQTILDSSSTPKTVTVFGNAQISTAQSPYSGGSSIAFDGSGDFITLPGGAAFELGTGDFTIELWIRFASFSGDQFKGIIDTRASGDGSNTNRWSLYFDGDDTRLRWAQNGINRLAANTLSINTWYFLTLCRASGDCRIFADGVQIGLTFADTVDYGMGTSRPVIGAFGNNTSGSNFNGFIDEFRITKGVGRYTAAFTPPTAPFPDA